MPDRTYNRRQFLQLTAGATIAYATATALLPRAVQAEEAPPTSGVQASEALNDPEVQTWLAMTVGPLFVAGQYLDAFKHNLDAENLPADLKRKYRLAGGEWKTWPAAKAIAETVPARLRAGGPDALWEFHKSKDWSHIVPRAVGGPATAENGIWWTAGKNRSLGQNPMSAADIADAKSLLNHAAITATLGQTVQASLKGGSAGIIVGATLGCLDLGLQHAEGQISREQFVLGIVERSVIAGAGAAFITGLLVALSLMFPAVIPIMLPVVFVLQIVSLAFLAVHAHSLLERWWEFLNAQGLLDGLNDVLETTEDVLSEMYDGVQGSVLTTIRGWVEQVARLVGIERAWQLLTNLLQEMGAEQALVWVAARSYLVTSKTSAIVSSLKQWNYEGLEPNMDPAEISRSIGRVVTSEFEGASATANAMRRSISEFRKTANLEGGNLALAVS